MFGFFRKKQAPGPVSVNENVVDKAVGLLNVQLMLCRSQVNFKQGLEREVVRGYLIGFFDCSLQRLGQPIHNDEEFFKLLLRGHALLLGQDIADTQSYTITSFRMQDNPSFAQGQAAGGTDCNDLLTGQSSRALTLMSYFMEE